MVALDDGSVASTGLDDIGVNGALSQEVHSANLLGLFLKDADKLLTDDLTLVLGLFHTSQLGQEAGLSVHPDEVHSPLGESGLHLVALILTHEAVVHEHTGELTAHSLGQQSGTHGGVHAAGQGQQHLTVAHLLPDGGNGGVLVVLHGPVASGVTDLIEEVADHLHTVFGVVDLGVILHAVEALLLVGDGHVGAVGAVGHQFKALGHLGHIVAVAHPGDALLGQALEDGAVGVVPGLGLAVLPGGVVLGRGDLAAQGVSHELAAVADAQHRHAPGEDLGVHLGGPLLIHRVGAAGKDDADGVHGLELGQGGGIGFDFAVHVALTHTAGNELVVLTAEVQNDDRLMCHSDSFLP